MYDNTIKMFLDENPPTKSFPRSISNKSFISFPPNTLSKKELCFRFTCSPVHSTSTMNHLSIPRLVTKTLFKPRELYGIEYNNTLFGIHVPRRVETHLTETHLFAFSRQQDAKDFLEELLYLKSVQGKWPSRIVKTTLQKRGSGILMRSSKHKQQYAQADEFATSKELSLQKLNTKKILRQCAMTGMLLRIGRKLPGGEGFLFESHDSIGFWRVNKQQIKFFLMCLFMIDD